MTWITFIGSNLARAAVVFSIIALLAGAGSVWNVCMVLAAACLIVSTALYFWEVLR